MFNKIKKYAHYFSVSFFVLVVGINFGAGYSNVLKASLVISEIETVEQAVGIFDVVISTSADSVEFRVENLGTATTAKGIIIQESIILREEMVNLGHGTIHTFAVSRSTTVMTYTLELTNHSTGVTTYHSVTI